MNNHYSQYFTWSLTDKEILVKDGYNLCDIMCETAF
jgi:hypothetical protein